MQLQAIEGYWENDRFYSHSQPICKKGRTRAILTLLEEPPLQINTQIPIEMSNEELQARLAWLKRLDDSLEDSKNEELLDFPTRQPMQEPHGLVD